MTQISFQLDIETKKIRKNQDSYGLKFIKKNCYDSQLEQATKLVTNSFETLWLR